MFEEIARLKPEILDELGLCLRNAGRDFAHVNAWAEDVLQRLGDFSGRGKMIRGGLVNIGMRAFLPDAHMETDGQHQASIRMAVVMELMQSLLLIHDDIMDQDDLRRGRPSMHAQYQQLSLQSHGRDAGRTGESMAICAGDASAFLALDLVARLDLVPALKVSLMHLVSRELTLVVLAQMGDVWNGSSPTEPGFDDILKLYRYKTGRYTFSLPLMAGAQLAQALPGAQSELGELGEIIGILFQIRDDDIGLFAGTAQTGKPSGTDIRENKKTLHRHFLLERCDIGQRKQLLSVFGNQHARAEEIELVLGAFESCGVRETIAAELDFYAGQARERIDRISGLNSWGRQILLSIVDWNLQRLA